MPVATRGEIWMVELNPTVGHEQAGRIPALVLSVDELNQSPAELVIVLPLTTRAKGVRSHVQVRKGEGGVKKVSYIKCEDLRSVSIQRLGRRLGIVSNQTMDTVEDVVRILLGL